ncbi:hypothetical protein OAT67_02375 [Bacteriovoracaceae bacterium]|nr:hypothetical protein [Bacteriovoracaceae bacterium]
MALSYIGLMMIDVRTPDDDEIHFMKCHFTGIDKLINDVISKKISSREALLLIWMSSYAWKDQKKKRNRFMLSTRRIAKLWGVTKVTMERYLKSLKLAGHLKPIYRIEEDGQVKTFTKQANAWNHRKLNGGSQKHSYHKILNEYFSVETGKNGQNYKTTEDD